ncbi:hypothetical protein NP493_38g04012 [Ridgeia piscesae]|uniref:HEAT repeat domain-containing protein n=1 Tax=Ridgeia piscesae TaxID=27915 RepID=A0AAD9PCR6_RIDPI|nr:hypothetical protein NP493_38g04012 [Ridgeia piscesae]
MDELPVKQALRLTKETQDVDTLVELTRHSDAVVRQRALKEMCPCRVHGDIAAFWKRLFEVAVTDPAAIVRRQALHNMCDGSPPHLELKIAEALDEFNRDRDPLIRRMAHKALTAYRKTGKWNVL